MLYFTWNVPFLAFSANFCPDIQWNKKKRLQLLQFNMLIPTLILIHVKELKWGKINLLLILMKAYFPYVHIKYILKRRLPYLKIYVVNNRPIWTGLMFRIFLRYLQVYYYIKFINEGRRIERFLFISLVSSVCGVGWNRYNWSNSLYFFFIRIAKRRT